MSVDGIFIAPSAGAAMKELVSAEVVTSRGIRGDRYHDRAGTYSVFRDSTKAPGRREPGRQITLVAAEGVEQGLMMNGIEALPSVGSFRRNVVLRGVPADDLQAAVGHEITLGEVVVFAHRSCVPCMYNERRNDRPGLMEALWDCPGICCEVIRGGMLKRGDPVSISPDAQPERVDGGKADVAGFLVRPSKRTKTMVKALMNAKNAAIPHLLKVDPGGMIVALESFQEVGLKLFDRPKRFRRGEAITERFFTMVALFVGLLVILMGFQEGKKWYDRQPLVTPHTPCAPGVAS